MLKKQLAAIVTLMFIIVATGSCFYDGGVDDTIDSPPPEEAVETVEPDDDPTPAPLTREDFISVGIVNTPASESGYREANIKDIESVFTMDNGYLVQTAYEGSHDAQVEATEGFIADGVDVLLISALQRPGWDLVLQEAANAGIRVFLFDRRIQTDLFEAAVVPDVYNQGTMAVRALEDLKLERYNIVHIQGEMESREQIGRTVPFMAKVDSNPDWSIVRQKPGDWNEATARQIVEDVIESGETFNVIYAESDLMAAGAVSALDDAGITHGFNDDGSVRDVVIVSVEANRWALRELLAGNWNFAVSCSPFQAEILHELIQGTRTANPGEIIVNPERYFDARTITQEEVDLFGIGD